jgi:hypothetical protein
LTAEVDKDPDLFATVVGPRLRQVKVYVHSEHFASGRELERDSDFAPNCRRFGGRRNERRQFDLAVAGT